MNWGLDVLTYVIPIFGVLVIVEFLYARHLYDLKESLSGFAIGAGATLISLFSKAFALGVFVFFFELFKELRIEYLGYSTLGWGWYIFALAIVFDDFNFYWHHRLSHKIRLLWAAHVPHHSSKSFNLIIGVRNGWFISLYKPIFWLWMPILGFEPFMIASCLIINSIYQFFMHTQLVPNLGWYEKIFNTPNLHSIHHSSNVEYLDKNHGGILIVWDRLFGTFQSVVPAIEQKFGITKRPKTHNPILLNTQEFGSIWKDVRKNVSWSNKLKYIFYPPGWSHDNSTMTVSEMQRENYSVENDVPLTISGSEE